MALPWLIIGLGNPPSQIQPGYRSLLAFWAGGAANAGEAPEPEPEPPPTPAPDAGGAGSIVGERIRRAAYENALDKYKAKLKRAQRQAQRERLEELDRIAARLSEQVESREKLNKQVESQSRLFAFYDRFAEALAEAGRMAAMAAAEAARVRRAQIEQQAAALLDRLIMEAEAAAQAEAELQEEEEAVVVLLLLT